MTAAGWYADPTGATDERWWNGARWTEHVRSTSTPVDAAAAGGIGAVDPASPGSGDLVRLTVKALEIAGGADRIAIRGKEFHLDAIDHVAYKTWIYRLNAAYMGTQFLMKLGQAGTTDRFLLDSGHRDGRLDEFRNAWVGLVGLLEARACPRIADQWNTVVFPRVVAHFTGR